MGTKSNPGRYDCYAAADPDEPIFVLRASDPLAADLVESWAAAYSQRPTTTPWVRGKISDAHAIARAMRTWNDCPHGVPKDATCSACDAAEIKATRVETMHESILGLFAHLGVGITTADKDKVHDFAEAQVDRAIPVAPAHTVEAIDVAYNRLMEFANKARNNPGAPLGTVAMALAKLMTR